MSMANTWLAVAWTTPGTILCWMLGRLDRDERGEGVISAAIAVLIMAFLGVGLWLAFKATLGSTTNAVNNQISQIGS
ncbi:MAG: hypothetical protein ACRDYD_03375 [Acidimicrobiales bacterium]